MVQIIDNRADIVGTVQSSDQNGALQVLVDNVSAVEGYPNLADDAVGQIVVVNVRAEDSAERGPRRARGDPRAEDRGGSVRGGLASYRKNRNRINRINRRDR